MSGEEVGWVVRLEPGQEAVAGRIASVVHSEPDRGIVGSVAYGIVVLVDTAIMALSPAVNDPSTAVQVIEEMTFLFEGLSKHQLGPFGLSSQGSSVSVQSRSFADYLALATGQIMLYGKDDPFVHAALVRMAGSLAALDLSPEDTGAVRALAIRLATEPA